ncbi:hypothetical protein CVT26_005332 [Gymnopilus dilepis]|uniref:Uncharacterized protein n=1 Tax=Gymnopilus dilepis TaxID=231916 RepID=A0A409YSU8_9AGAR|nr:hypothetical protein CVT26_005332 [Gymnopilus dilepis]
MSSRYNNPLNENFISLKLRAQSDSGSGSSLMNFETYTESFYMIAQAIKLDENSGEATMAGRYIREKKDSTATQIGQYLDSPQDVVLQGLTNICFYVKWPGYGEEAWTTSVKLAKGGVSKAELARKISKSIACFIRAVNDLNIECDFPEWKVGPGGILAENLYLHSVINISDRGFMSRFRFTVL